MCCEPAYKIFMVLIYDYVCQHFRKRSSEESTGTLSNGDCRSNSKSPKSLNTGLFDSGQTDGVQEESTLNETVVASSMILTLEVMFLFLFLRVMLFLAAQNCEKKCSSIVRIQCI